MTNSWAGNQLGRALVTAARDESVLTRVRAAARVRAWASVIDDMRSGTIEVGSRTPIIGLPAWATLDVLRGGFAISTPMAEVPLQDDEILRAARLGLPRSRAAVFASYLTDDGLAELRSIVASGAYEVRIPEDAVLLVIGYLATSGHRLEALDLLNTVRPFVDTLRFVPRAASPRRLVPGQVSRRTAQEVREHLESTEPRPQVEAQREALTVWLPMTDRWVMFWQSTEDSDGRIGRVWTEPHSERAKVLIDDYERSLVEHQQCRKYRSAKENLPKLVAAARMMPHDLSEAARAGVERILTQIAAKRGTPQSQAFRDLRARQDRVAADPSHRRIAQVAAARCARLRRDEGIVDPAAVLVPVSPDEAEAFRVPVGTPMPSSAIRKVRLGTVGTPEALLADGVIRSAEVLADLVPALTGHQLASSYDDADLGRLVAAIYEAFRRRRSLLLLNLAKQVQFEELPWVAALPDPTADPRVVLSVATGRRLAAVALDAFPGTILPNPLIRELTTLFATGGEPLPLVPELAADIFTGRFSRRFAEAAHIAAGVMHGSLYEHYYGLDYTPLLSGVPDTTTFDRLCAEAVAGVPGQSLARNGMVIERQHLLTTQNLAVLVAAGGVRPNREWPDLAVAAALRCARLLQLAQHQARPLTTLKDAAHAWRQALFFLTRAGSGEHLHRFVTSVRSSAEGSRQPMTQVLDGLTSVAGGGRFDASGRSGSGRRLLGWTVTPHWAVAPHGAVAPGEIPETEPPAGQ